MRARAHLSLSDVAAARHRRSAAMRLQEVEGNPLSAAQAAGVRPKGAIAFQLVLFAINMTIGISYEVVLIGKYGATLGKMACKIKVVTADGGRVSYLRALGRYFAKMLSGFTCLIGFIIAAFDGQKRALHDHICNTRVVFK